MGWRRDLRPKMGVLIMALWIREAEDIQACVMVREGLGVLVRASGSSA